jgi:hypothetical protein
MDRSRVDQNLRNSLIAVSRNDGVTPVSLWADPTTHALDMSHTTTGFVVSTANSSTANLSAGATYTGTIEAVPSAQTVSVNVFSDQAGTVTFNQYIDGLGTQKLLPITETVTAGIGWSRAFTANSNYFNVVFTNNSGSATTSLNINTAYGTLPMTTNLGNGPVALNELNGTAIATNFGAPTAGVIRTVAVSDVTVTGGSLNAPIVNTELLTATVSGWYDAAAFNSVSLTIQTGAGISAGVLTFEQTNDIVGSPNGNFWTIRNEASVTTAALSAITLSASTTLTYSAAVTARYVRVRVSTAVVGGSVQATANFSQMVWSGASIAVQGLPNAAAMADSLATPTTTQIGAIPLLFNNTTNDRFRNNVNTTTGDAGAKVATFNGATQTNYNAAGASITVLCGTVTGTVPTMNAQLQWSPDSGTTWLNLGPASGNVTATGNTISIFCYPTNYSQAAGLTPANLTNGATQSVLINAALPRTWRLVYTIGGTTPSFTITAAYVNYTL